MLHSEAWLSETLTDSVGVCYRTNKRLAQASVIVIARTVIIGSGSSSGTSLGYIVGI